MRVTLEARRYSHIDNGSHLSELDLTLIKLYIRLCGLGIYNRKQGKLQVQVINTNKRHLQPKKRIQGISANCILLEQELALNMRYQLTYALTKLVLNLHFNHTLTLFVLFFCNQPLLVTLSQGEPLSTTIKVVTAKQYKTLKRIHGF